MSDKIAWHCYTHLETKREKEIQETYAYTYNYRQYKETLRQTERKRERNADQDTYISVRDSIAEYREMYSERKREKNIDQETEIYTYIEWQYSQTLLQICREKEKNKPDQQTYMHIQSNISGHWNGHSEPKRETEIRINRRTYTRRINNIT